MPRETFGADYRFLPSSERLSFDQMVKLEVFAVNQPVTSQQAAPTADRYAL